MRAPQLERLGRRRMVAGAERKWCRAVRACKVGSPIVGGEPKWSPDVREKHTGLPANGGPAVGRNQGLADCPSRSSYRIKLGPSPSTARAAQRWPAGVQASATAGSVSPGCFLRISPCMPVCIFEPAAGSSFCRSPEASQCLLCSSPIFSSGFSFHVVGEAQRLGLQVAGGRLAQHLSQQSPHGKPYMGLRVPQGLSSSASAPSPAAPSLSLWPEVFWQCCRGLCRAGGGCLCPQEGLPAPTWGPQGTIWPRNSYGRGAGGSPHPLGPGGTPGLTPSRTITWWGPPGRSTRSGCQLVPCTGPPEPVPTTGKVWGPVSLATDVRRLLSRESGRNSWLSRLPNKPPASPWSLVT